MREMKKYGVKPRRTESDWIGHILRGNCFLKHVSEGWMDGWMDRGDGKTRKKT